MASACKLRGLTKTLAEVSQHPKRYFSASPKQFLGVGSPGQSREEEERNVLKAKMALAAARVVPLPPYSRLGVPAARMADRI